MDLTSYFSELSFTKSLQSCPTLCNPRDSSPPGSPIPGILQARTLEWVAIAFSRALLYCSTNWCNSAYCTELLADSRQYMQSTWNTLDFQVLELLLLHRPHSWLPSILSRRSALPPPRRANWKHCKGKMYWHSAITRTNKHSRGSPLVPISHYKSTNLEFI